jgi:flavin reductase (DIM6/NTAB) family NADH-FMN oxidoreductase RutF
MTITADPTTPAGLDADLFKGLLRRQASTVTVVTAQGERPAGFTATSFTSVSLHPPLVSFCVARTSSSWPIVARAEHLAVHLLAADQQDLARRFATSGIDRFASPTAWQPGPYDVPILHGTLAWLLCRVVDRVAAGDHAVVLAEPLLSRHGQGTPLLYHDGRYAGLEQSPIAQSSNGGQP